MNDGKIFWPSYEDRELAVQGNEQSPSICFLDSGPEAVREFPAGSESSMSKLAIAMASDCALSLHRNLNPIFMICSRACSLPLM